MADDSGFARTFDGEGATSFVPGPMAHERGDHGLVEGLHGVEAEPVSPRAARVAHAARRTAAEARLRDAADALRAAQARLAAAAAEVSAAEAAHSDAEAEVVAALRAREEADAASPVK